jgi:DNA-binding NarL/FixJ family response regulator
MKDAPITILLFESSSRQDDKLKKLLENKGFLVESAARIDVVIEKIMSHSVNLVISRNQVNEFTGFEIFKILEKYLRNCGIPFFLVLDTSEREDMIIGLEMGIDNFIFHPYNEISLYCKIENQLKKREELNIFATNHFMDFFNSSAVAMFFVSGNKIAKVNEAFNKMYNGCSFQMIDLPVDTIFNIRANKQNDINFRRFQNGITNECHLTNVSCNYNPGCWFNVDFFRGNHINAGVYFAELLPTVVSETMAGSVAVNQNLNHSFKEDNYDFDDDDDQQHQFKLTKREAQIFELSAKGLPIKLIADHLELSERTVEKHRANIMEKANAKNMIEAIVKIHNNGL